jgi:hypothetical protein
MNAARLLFAAGCLAVLSVPAIAAGPDSDVSIAQAGTATPRGGNVSFIIQQGSQNYAESDQTGAMNTDVIEQLGNNNSSTIKQQGIGGVVVDIQLGNGNSFKVTQTGIDPPPVILVQRR